MNIGIVCYPTYGGSGVLATELGMRLAKMGNNVHFISYKRPARLTGFHERIFLHEVRSMEYPLFEYTPYETALTSKLVDVVLHEKLDILHVHYAVPHASVAHFAKLILKSHNIDLPVITTLHGTDITLVGKNESYASVVEFSINASDAVTTVSQNLKQQTIDLFDITVDINVIYNFIDFSQFDPNAGTEVKRQLAPNNEFVITHMSNFRKVKRVEDVIYVFDKIIKSGIAAKLFLIGDGPERQKLESLCRELSLCDQIIFLGKQEAIVPLLAASDLFLLPSKNESFGLSALEAMGVEVPIISTNVGGLPEVNTHGETGYLSDVGQIEEMANYAISLLNNPELLDKFKKNARKRALQFDISQIVPQYEKLYRKVLKRVKN